MYTDPCPSAYAALPNNNVIAHTSFSIAAGATEEEIKTAVAIAADVALNSSMLYGTQFDMDEFMKMFE